jgi:hypothetical protein
MKLDTEDEKTEPTPPSEGISDGPPSNGGGDPKWLVRTKSHATILSEAYRLRLVGRLWWANLIFVVLPAVFSTTAAIFAALAGKGGAASGPVSWAAGLAAGLAGAAAVLVAIHRALKCEEYQAECLRLSQSYQSIAIWADSALSSPAKDPRSLEDLTKKYELLTENAKAPLPTIYIRKAEELTGLKLYKQSVPNMKAESDSRKRHWWERVFTYKKAL